MAPVKAGSVIAGVILGFVYTVSGTAVAAVTTGVPAPSPDPGYTSCNPALSMLSACTIATPNFLDLPFSVEASCLCYSGSVWRPGVYDSYWDVCNSHLATASPSAFTALGPSSPCQLVGDVKASPTLTNVVDLNSVACDVFSASESSCAAETPSFTALAFSVQASCLCYSMSTYAPQTFDGIFGSCLAYIKTADPSLYSSLRGSTLPRTPCVEVGNVITGAPTATGSLILSAAATGLATPGSLASAIPTSTSSSSNPPTAVTTTEPTSAEYSGGEPKRVRVFPMLALGLIVLLLR